MDIVASGFEWDSGNRDKCQKHGVAIAEIEDFFERPFAVWPAPERSADESRFKAIGTNKEGRHIFIVFTLRNRGGEVVVRPISARYMHEKEVRHYENAASKVEKTTRSSDRSGG